MNKEELKNYFDQFGNDIKFDQDLKKKIGSILVENQKFFTLQII